VKLLHPKAYNGRSRLLRNVPSTTLHGKKKKKVTAVRTSNINQKYIYMVQGETEKFWKYSKCIFMPTFQNNHATMEQ
jgi:hypothetical protein